MASINGHLNASDNKMSVVCSSGLVQWLKDALPVIAASQTTPTLGKLNSEFIISQGSVRRLGSDDGVLMWEMEGGAGVI